MVSVQTPLAALPPEGFGTEVEIQSVGRSVSAVAFTEDGCGASRRGERDGEIAGIGVVRQDWNHHGLHGDVLFDGDLATDRSATGIRNGDSWSDAGGVGDFVTHVVPRFGQGDGFFCIDTTESIVMAEVVPGSIEEPSIAVGINHIRAVDQHVLTITPAMAVRW